MKKIIGKIHPMKLAAYKWRIHFSKGLDDIDNEIVDNPYQIGRKG